MHDEPFPPRKLGGIDTEPWTPPDWEKLHRAHHRRRFFQGMFFALVIFLILGAGVFELYVYWHFITKYW